LRSRCLGLGNVAVLGVQQHIKRVQNDFFNPSTYFRPLLFKIKSIFRWTGVELFLDCKGICSYFDMNPIIGSPVMLHRCICVAAIWETFCALQLVEQTNHFKVEHIKQMWLKGGNWKTNIEGFFRGYNLECESDTCYIPNQIKSISLLFYYATAASLHFEDDLFTQRCQMWLHN